MTHRRAWAAVGVCSLWLSVSVSADTLVLRDGRRVQGELIAVRDGVVEFEGQRGLFGGRERLRVDRGDIVRIELDEAPRSNLAEPSAPGSARPSGLRERDVSVDAAAGWRDTGVTVRPGQTVYFEATGRVLWGPGRQDGPAGERGSPRNDSRPIPARPAAALIGRIGDSDEYFFVGDEQGAMRMRAGGRLSLGVNDDFLQDNSGAFRVTVYY